jgi:uncharacterized protein YbaR (Trm112 family)
MLVCSHPLCLGCSKSLRTPSCPVCRGPLNVNKGSAFDTTSINAITARHTQDRKELEDEATQALLRSERNRGVVRVRVPAGQRLDPQTMFAILLSLYEQ